MTEDPSAAPERVRRRGPRWVQLGYGIQMPSGLEGPAATIAELTAWLPLLPPSAVFTGLTAARLHGLWLPTYMDGLPHSSPWGRSLVRSGRTDASSS